MYEYAFILYQFTYFQHKHMNDKDNIYIFHWGPAVFVTTVGTID